jgi:hypothetical protein
MVRKFEPKTGPETRPEPDMETGPLGDYVSPVDRLLAGKLDTAELRQIALAYILKAAETGSPAVQAQAGRTILEAIGVLGSDRESLAKTNTKSVASMTAAEIAAELNG